MKEITIEQKIFDGIKQGDIKQIILKDNLKNEETIRLKSQNEVITVLITAKAKYKDIADCLKIIPYDLFGFTSSRMAKLKYKDIKPINAYRVKYDSDMVEEITNQELLSLIDEKTLKKNNVGHSSNSIYEVSLKDGQKAILKIQKLSNRNDLYDEYQRLKWLTGKCSIPKIYYYGEKDNIKYLLMEKIEGQSAHKITGYAGKIGKLLRQVHSINISDCPFNQNDTNKLLKSALNNIDIIYPQVKEIYPKMTKQDTINFLKDNIPKDTVLVHGDYSLPNIIIDTDGKISLIDLGDLSISSKYFDFFYLKKSMIRNKQIDKFDELLKAYGITQLDDNYMKWMEIVDKGLF